MNPKPTVFEYDGKCIRIAGTPDPVWAMLLDQIQTGVLGNEAPERPSSVDASARGPWTNWMLCWNSLAIFTALRKALGWF